LGTTEDTEFTEKEKTEIVLESYRCVQCFRWFTAFVYIFFQKPKGTTEDTEFTEKTFARITSVCSVFSVV